MSDVSFHASGLDWIAEPAAADVVRRGIAEHLNEIEALPGATLIKRNLVRTVYRVPLSGAGTVIVKRYAVRGPIDWAKYTVRPSRAAEEWRVGRWLDAAGISTAVPLAMGEHRNVVLRDAALVTREIADALHLNAFVETHLQGDAGRDAGRVRLYDDLARIVRRMHDAGFVHNDLHGGNVLVNGPPDAPRIYIIDLHSVQRSTSGPAAPRKRWFDLVKLLHSLRTCSSVAEREQICRTYEAAGGAAGSAPSGTPLTALLGNDGRGPGRGPDLGAVLEPRLAAMERKRVRSRTRRCLDRSSRHDIARLGPFRIHHLRTVEPAALLAPIEAHRRTLAAGGAAVLKDARRSALTRQTLVVNGAARSVIVKEYRCKGVRERLKNLMRTPRAIAAWIAGNGLVVRGFRVAEPLALLLRGRRAGLAEAFLVMEDLGDAQRLDLVTLARFAGRVDAAGCAEKRRLVAAVARTFRRLHDEGVYHADLKAVSLFLDETDGRAELVFADYDRVQFDRPVTPRRRIKNLAQLSASVPVCISVVDRLRFFGTYAGDDLRMRENWKRWFQRIIADCERKIVVRMEPIE